MIELVKKNILYVVLVLVVCFAFKNEISIGLMYAVDIIGYITGANVVEVIDFLNDIYYL